MLKFILLHSCVLFNTPYTMDDQNETSQKKKNETFNYMHNKKHATYKRMSNTVALQMAL